VTGLSAAVSSADFGPNSISVRDSTPTTFSSVGSIIVSVPNPALLGFSYSVTPTTGSTYNVNDSVVITVWDFPASQSVTFWLGPTAAGSLTTDSNGAGTITTVVPPVPGGTYTPVALDNSMSLTTSPTTGTTSYTISPFFQAVDPTGAALIASGSTSGEYVPSSGMITVQAYGLNPTSNAYDFYDSIVAPSSSGMGVYASGLVTGVSVGSETTNLLQPASNGTLIFTYSPGYASLSPTTGTAGTITSANSVSGYDGNSYAYYAIGTATISAPTSYEILLAGATGQAFTFSGLIPSTATLYPGVTNEYNAYIGSSEITVKFTNANSVVVTGTTFNSADSSFSFNVPSTNGLFNLNITYNGQSVATGSVASQPIVISSTGSSPSSGTLVVVPTSTGYEIVGYGYSATPYLYYSVYGGTKIQISPLTFSDGAFAVALSTPSEPAGTYAVFTELTSSNVNYFVYSTYTVTASLTLDGSASPMGYVGSTVTVATTGLVTTPGYYSLYFGTNFVEYSSAGGTFASFTVPTVPAGSYNVAVKQVGSTAVVANQTFTVKANPDLTLSTNSQYAFPGQLVQFSASGFTAPGFGFNNNQGTTEYFAVIAFNGTPVATVPASLSGGTLSGSFINPNNAVGSYYKLTITGYEQKSKLTSLLSGSIMNGSLIQAALTGSQSDYFGLVTGNGALLTGISSSQIATLEADVNSTVSASLTVPISQLNAAITSVNGAVANLKTTVGNITTDLKTINATVASIENGMVLVQSDLGSIKTSLASLNASIIAFDNNVVTINTTLGQVVTSLGNINAKVTANSNGIANITTSLGTISGTVTATNGKVATIQTSLGTLTASLGTLTANVSKIQSQTSGFPTLEIFLIVIIVLVLITLVISFLAVNAANKAARRATEEKKQ
jgi:hypothetical protein